MRIVLQNKVANMKRRRAPGGGRKARAGPTSSLTFRIPDDLRRELELESNGSVSERLIWHLRRSINRKRHEERDPALRGLLLLIARLAEEIVRADLIPDHLKDFRSSKQREWRTDLSNFRAFKFAVKKLLDTLEEPPESLSWRTEEEVEQMRRKAAEELGGPPEFTKLFLEIEKSPEAKGAWIFGNVWTRFTNSQPYPESAQRVMRDNPLLGRAIEREERDFQIARKALQLEPEEEDEFEAAKRMMKDRNLDPENEPMPPDIQEALDLINDRRIALSETTRALPKIEWLKLFRSNPLPTLNEALKLLKTEKRKDKRR